MLALVMILGCGKDEPASAGPGAATRAELDAKRYAFEAYPRWAMVHPDKACPDKISELDEYVPKEATKDPWGNVYTLLCGENTPPGVKGVAVFSPGPDGKPNTADDIKSWK